jgi:LysM repeat protein
MNDPRQEKRIVITPQTMVLAALALAVLALAALVTLVVATRFLGQRQPSGPLVTATGNGTQIALGPAASAVLGPTSTALTGPLTHTVQPGETLIGIANQYAVPVEMLQSANHLANPRLIIPGQVLVIPNTAILTPLMPLGTLTPSPTPTLQAEDPANLSLLSGWPRSLADGTSQQLEANYPLVVQQQRFRFHYQPGTYPDHYLEEVVNRVERALANVEARLGVHLDGTFDVYAAGTLFTADDAHLRGQSRSLDRRLFFLSDGTGTPAENDYVVTHELTHLIAWNTWGSPSSTLLSEGLATYDGKAELESGGFLPYDQLCLGIVASGQLPPLATIERDYLYFQGHIENRFDYFGSACFVQYLIDTYGLESMSRLYHSSDYQALYGKPLADLDQAWRTSLLARQTELTLDPGALVSFTNEVTQAYKYVFKNMNDTAPMHQAYLAVDRARISLWEGDYQSTRTWLNTVYNLTGLTPQPNNP